MEDWQARIEIDEENLGGKPVIKGTGVAIHVLLQALADGESEEAVIVDHHIRIEDLRAALAYGTDTVTDEVIHAAPKGRINSDPRILGGKPVIMGTRVPVQVLLGALAGGDSIDRVSEGWRVSREDVLAAIAYAARSVALETVHALSHR